jgi:hypothetical protein
MDAPSTILDLDDLNLKELWSYYEELEISVYELELAQTKGNPSTII